jgi:hypothetical protein
MNDSKLLVFSDDSSTPSTMRTRGVVQVMPPPSARPRPRYVFSAQLSVVAQICNLPYRRFVIGRACENSSALALADATQNAILRYSRLQICATLNRCLPRGEGEPFASAEMKLESFEYSQDALSCSLSPRERARVRGNKASYGLRSHDSRNCQTV